MKPRKNPYPVSVSTAETICYAIKFLENEIADMEAKCNGKPEVQDILENFVAMRRPKVEILKQKYLLETGNDYA